jgi:hypothetical protein
VTPAITPADLYVDQARCTSPGTGTSADPFCTIAAAAAVVQAGQTVYIEAGTYAEHFIALASRSTSCGQPQSVVLNVTATRTTHSGYLTVYPVNGTRPATSNLNFQIGSSTAGLTMVRGNGATIYNRSGGTTHVIVDERGYYIAGPG